ncbi:MAG TPA: methyltransferase domain-containing protein [Sunxiuqinia sp.]|nr:methyltransferase domain-containing protein [Sunxiuqinia sp.]
MIKALDKEHIKQIYNQTSSYYDWFHRVGTFNLDNRGRKFLVKHTVKNGDYILDAGGGTGTTGLLALEKSGLNGKLVVLDASKKMLKKAEFKAASKKYTERVTTQIGDMYEIPYPDNSFDVVLSTYSTCPLENPAHAVQEMKRVLKPNGLLGIAHSTEPNGKIARYLTNLAEKLIWKFPRLSLGCRKIDLSNEIQKPGFTMIENKLIGLVPWYFRLIILKKIQQ